MYKNDVIVSRKNNRSKPMYRSGIFLPGTIRISWRDTWYGVIIWLTLWLTAGLVILPWYFLILPLIILWVTVIYFRKGDNSLQAGLSVSIIWFLIMAVLDFLQILGPYYDNAFLYFSDSRNWVKYPLLLLVPVIYCLVFEALKSKHIAESGSGNQISKIRARTLGI